MIKLKCYYPSFHRSRKAGSENTCRLMSIWVLDPTQTARLSNLKYFLCSKFCRGHTYAKKITFLFEIQTELDFLYLPSNPRLQAIFFFPCEKRIFDLEGHCGPSQIKGLTVALSSPILTPLVSGLPEGSVPAGLRCVPYSSAAGSQTGQKEHEQ